MDKIEAIESLLPGFREFLNDLSLISLTSGLKQKVVNYQQRIDDYTDQHSSAPGVPLPPLPTIQTSNGPIDVEKLRQEAWRLSKDTANEYQNTQVGEIPEELYEEPMTNVPPKLPSMESRPPIKKNRIVDETEDVYEDPDDSTTESGRGSMPPGSVSDEGSGSTFIFPQGGGEIPEDDYNSDSTDYDPVDEPEERHITEKPKKKVNKLEVFLEDHASESDIDLIDRLFYYNNMISTIKGGISLGKWEKRYCIAKDGQLFLYKSYDKKAKSQRTPLMGLDVWYIGVQSNKDFVFRISHHSMKHPLLLAADNKAVADKWTAVLKRYATIDHTIMPSSGYQADGVEEAEHSPAGKKGGKLFSRDKKDHKENDRTPQLSVDATGVLSGHVNIVGAKYGEPKIKRRWIVIKDVAFSCSPGKDEVQTFSFNMNGMQIEIADKKEVKMKGAFKLSQDGEVLLYIEALNMLDAGLLLKTMVSASLGKKPDRTSAVDNGKNAEDGMVMKLLAAFENTSPDQTDGNQTRPARSLSPPYASSPPSPSSPEETYQHITDTPQEDTYDDIPGTPQEETYDNISGAPQEETYENSRVLAKPQDSSTRRRFLVKKIFQNNRHSSVEAPVYDDAVSSNGLEKLYDDIDLPPAPEIKTPQQRKVLTLPHLRGKKDKEATSPTPDSPQLEKKETEKERKAREKKEKKEKEKKEKKEKEKEKEEKKQKKKEEKEAAAAKEAAAREAEEEKVAPTPAPAALETPPVPKEEMKKSPMLQRKASAAQNKFKDSEMSHLLLKDKLMQDRKELEGRKKEAMKKKVDIRAKMMATSDPAEKEKLKLQVEVAQSEWSEINKKLVKISVDIEAATGDKKDANSNDEDGVTIGGVTRSSIRTTSSDTEKVSKGTVQDRMKMFQQGN